MKKLAIIGVLVCLPGLGFCQQNPPLRLSTRLLHQENDSLVWKVVTDFSSTFNSGDTAAMSHFLPDDFILQWMHENFVGKKNLLKAMVDSAVLKTMQHTIDRNEKAVLRYSDDQTAVSINTNFEFLDSALLANITRQRGYGVCILYLQKRDGRWLLKTIHLDLHCALCNL